MTENKGNALVSFYWEHQKNPAYLSKDSRGVFDKMLKQSDSIHRFATKFGLLAGIRLCVEAIMTSKSIFGALGFLLQATYL